MKQISDRAKKLIENLLGWSTAPEEGEYEYDEFGRCVGGFAYVDQAQSELEHYIATLEAEVEALRPYRDGFDPKERLPEVDPRIPIFSVDVFVITDDSVDGKKPAFGWYSFFSKGWFLYGYEHRVDALRWFPYIKTEQRRHDEA